MGFLDHSTNNIIIDAVLTDYGRQRLAENNGQFRIQFFSLGDDEVDYGIIKKYGRTVGKEKITKNTPIFEAGTRSASAMRYRMLTLPNPTIFQMPSLTLVSDNTANVISIVGVNQTKAVEIAQQVGTSNAELPTGLKDATYTVYVNDRFLTVMADQGATTAASLGPPDPVTKMKAYSVNRTQNEFSIAFKTKPGEQLSTAAFATYGINGKITTPVTIVGDQTGLRLDFKFEIQQSNVI